LKISPDHPSMTKPIVFTVHIADEHGKTVSNVQVHGVLNMKLMDMGKTPLKFVPKGSGDYEASMKSMDMSGPWSLDVDASDGTLHAKKTFDITVFD
jgi:nitrogen fixation protein FixH